MSVSAVAPAAPPLATTPPPGATPPADHLAAGDPRVLVAFRLGWHMAELYHAHFAPRAADELERSKVEGGLAGVGSLDRADRARLLHGQIDVETRLLEQVATVVHVELPRLEEGEDQSGIAAAHKKFLIALTSLDFRLGKAYGLARALAETVLLPGEEKPGSYEEKFMHGRIEVLRSWLADLSSAFPAHAAFAVRHGLREWSVWITEGRPSRHQQGDLTRALRDQGRLWRALLSGERNAADLLSPADYTQVARRLVHQLRELTGSFLRDWWWLVLLVLAILAGGTVAFFTLSGPIRSVSAVLTVVTTLGISWKAVGATVGRAFSQAEQSLYRKEVEEAIATAATRLPASGSATTRAPSTKA